ncbi:hypothetical protein IEQ34_019464 [Dendrobium chrysotoxum]|uniref:Uncharacterized protein n=1 Tax=Dendrobium chrysotoxum TaxID=161865 RepID=A0AAV7G8R7_DENCH|nr:hypothetical protein IEQ34_019464 [Dendrobium chrysotoxum]
MSLGFFLARFLYSLSVAKLFRGFGSEKTVSFKFLPNRRNAGDHVQVKGFWIWTCGFWERGNLLERLLLVVSDGLLIRNLVLNEGNDLLLRVNYFGFACFNFAFLCQIEFFVEKELIVNVTIFQPFKCCFGFACVVGIVKVRSFLPFLRPISPALCEVEFLLS